MSLFQNSDSVWTQTTPNSKRTKGIDLALIQCENKLNQTLNKPKPSIYVALTLCMTNRKIWPLIKCEPKLNQIANLSLVGVKLPYANALSWFPSIHFPFRSPLRWQVWVRVPLHISSPSSRFPGDVKYCNIHDGCRTPHVFTHPYLHIVLSESHYSFVKYPP